jgi:threonine dehydrogenase-like Zn-dependent dehydrogenase
LIKPAAVGLCGTDLDILAGRIDPTYVRYPLVLGHEWSGTVLASASGAVPPGTRVVAEGIVPCGHCAHCRAGQTNLCATYDEMGFTRDGAAAGYAWSATLVTPGAYREHGRRGAGGVCLGRLPGAGQHHGRQAAGPWWSGTAPWPARDRAARPVVPGRDRDAGPPFGAGGSGRDYGAARFETGPEAADGGYDLVVEAAGTTGAVLTALAAARRGGTILLLGLPRTAPPRPFRG